MELSYKEYTKCILLTVSENGINTYRNELEYSTTDCLGSAIVPYPPKSEHPELLPYPSI